MRAIRRGAGKPQPLLLGKLHYGADAVVDRYSLHDRECPRVHLEISGHICSYGPASAGRWVRQPLTFRVLKSRYNALGFWVALSSGGASANAAFMKTSKATTTNVLIGGDPISYKAVRITTRYHALHGRDCEAAPVARSLQAAIATEREIIATLNRAKRAQVGGV